MLGRAYRQVSPVVISVQEKRNILDIQAWERLG
jgi:hypothetical protein